MYGKLCRYFRHSIIVCILRNRIKTALIELPISNTLYYMASEKYWLCKKKEEQKSEVRVNLKRLHYYAS